MIAPLLPPRHGNQQVELRAIVNGIFYLNATGCQWRALPHEYPIWSSVYYHFAKWSGTGTLEAINTALCKMDRQKRGRTRTPSGALIDSQSIKTASEVGFDGGKLVKDHKRHMLTDTVGNMLNVVVSATNVSDIAGASWSLKKSWTPSPPLRKSGPMAPIAVGWSIGCVRPWVPPWRWSNGKQDTKGSKSSPNGGSLNVLLPGWVAIAV